MPLLLAFMEQLVSEIFARVERTFEIPRMVKAVNPNQVDEANLWLRRER